MTQQQSENHTIIQSIIFHLLPGILIGGFYFLIQQPVQNLGYPSIFALMLAIAFILVPVEFGYLLYKGKQANGRYTLAGIISYRNAVPWWQILIWSLIVFIATGAIFAVLKPLESILQESLFFWVPPLDSGLDGSYSKTALVITYATMLIFGVIVGPLVEELYFRGYLLPRVQGKFSVIFHSFLFATYHIFTPWMIISRTIGLLPLIYAVKRKNIYIGIIVHIVVNSLDVLTAVAFIVSMT